MYGSLRFKGIVSDHGSTALAVIYIGYGIKFHPIWDSGGKIALSVTLEY